MNPKNSLTQTEENLRSRYGLTPLEAKIVAYMRVVAPVTAKSALNKWGVTSGSLSRRVTSLRRKGFDVQRVKRLDPGTQREFTEYRMEG